jgi:carbamoylphosphate synthase small subunit
MLRSGANYVPCDYSGTQAIKALKEEGIATVLINPNIASVQFHPEASPGPEDTAFLFDDFMRLVGWTGR